MSKSPTNLIEVGFIRAAHGLRGQVVVHAYSRDPQSLVGYGALVGADGKTEYTLTLVNEKGTDFLCRVTGVTDRNAAEALRGVKLFVPEDRLPPAGDNEFYIKDLIGLSVANSEERILGKVADVMILGDIDALEIDFIHDGKNPLEQPRRELLLFTDENILEVDLEDKKRIIIDLPYGLLDDPLEADNDG
jgi:16S rRNA processing protein RimM